MEHKAEILPYAQMTPSTRRFTGLLIGDRKVLTANDVTCILD